MLIKMIKAPFIVKNGITASNKPLITAIWRKLSGC